MRKQQPLLFLCFSSFTFELNNVRCWSHVCWYTATCPLPVGEHLSAVLIKGMSPCALDFGVIRSHEDTGSQDSVLKGFLECFPQTQTTQMQKTNKQTNLKTKHRKPQQNLEVQEQMQRRGKESWGWQVPRIRSSPGVHSIGFEICYLCKKEVCGKSLVRVYVSIRALDQVIENWSHLCKLYNNQEE